VGKRNDEFANYIADLLAPLGPIHWRAMFGGYGVYCGELFFALIIEEVLYFKADDVSRGRFEAEQLPPFTYDKQGKTAMIRYYQAPDLIFDDEEALREWGNLALEAALRARKGKPAPKAKPVAGAVVKTAKPVKKTKPAAKPASKAAAPGTKTKAVRKPAAGKST
jgi:DNA transformation protein